MRGVWITTYLKAGIMVQIISIGSFRRAVGRSIVSANLAAQAALAGWRVGLADLDDLFPSPQSTLFGLPDTAGSLVDLLHEKIDVASVGADAFADPEPKVRLKVFPWVSSPVGGNPDVKISDLQKALSSLSRYHALDFLLVDLKAGMTDFNLTMAAISDCCLIVTRPDQMDYQGTALMVEIVRKLNDTWVLLIANQVLARYDSSQVREQISTTFQAPTSVLPFSEDIAMAGSRGLFSLRYPNHPWSRGVRSIAASLFSDLAGRAADPPRPASPPSLLNPSLRNFLTRRDTPKRPSWASQKPQQAR